MIATLFAALVAATTADCRHLPAPVASAAVPNDNRIATGTLRDGVLTLRLVARIAAWRPDGPAGCALGVNAFAEEDRPARIPGPMIRVTAGTQVHVRFRNALSTALWIRGLQDRSPGILDSVEVAPGATREFQFTATAPGAWYYWAGSATAHYPASDVNGQLVGALVVDAPMRAGATPKRDRVMVLTRWTPSGTVENKGFQLNAFNGRSWPNTERLTYSAGDSVIWHVINASNSTHEMHLHGFYFRTDARGYDVDSVGASRAGIGGMRVTGVLRPGEWNSIAWSPDRPGNWLYHCHLLTHMSGAQRLDRMPGASAANASHEHAHDAAGNHAMDDMGGLVLGLDVRPSRRANAGQSTKAAAVSTPRTIDIFANKRVGVFDKNPGYGFVVQEGLQPPAMDSIRIPGTPLILTKGEPVRITVHNRLSIPISVHWHGIELDSYFDGVGGFSGSGSRIAPMVASNDSFVVRFTPPRGGTFMYHVHGESGEELASGLYAPLVVVEPGATFDPRTERIFVFADGGPGEGKPIFVNGSASPDTMELIAGTTYRMRMIFIAANDIYFATLRGPTGPVMAQLIAGDGHDVPAGPPIMLPMRSPTGPGHTRDVLFTPTAPGNYAFDVVRRLNIGLV
ncbi:MAG TPA: multicopper oxidase domain-containing protein [Gemmatimonadaceae bacterium]|nr:multicopper oxidase domain-containing protein [Gemmatimonadaceae bacterium]